MAASLALQDKVVLITGASKGIGRAIALKVASLGARVVINYSRDSSAAESLVFELNNIAAGRQGEGQGGDRALAVQADAGSVAGITQLVDAAVAKFGRIDVLVPNAGIMPLQDLAHTTEELFDRTYALNVKGPLFLAQKAVPHMGSDKETSGRIIFVSTGVVRSSAVNPLYALYASTKGAVEQISRCLSKELGPKGITVNCVAPGPTGTDLFFEGKSEAMIKGISAASPFQRLGTPEEIAGVVAFLAGADSAWVSGQVLGVNGAAFV
ncbi:uncharacterized protein B0I36DRAFT_239538 [Microdochium trichocladiopsis]|uniref:Uncharacterized protein n=1 Tax=Microdochium trichocladiopsis TaxID=1682393 RepID=A0A9P8Y9Z8_9PEZI|nr:uncharacterized protein B0I36DRAFT_239538 [Microdochium trichocladiopsis]KAH7034643.1 hypothetical protein B0I36DRAFT_239538 [Microdochium trichocladiopsis]